MVELMKDIERFDRQQLPFAKARALYFTAQGTRKSMASEYSKAFNIKRNKNNPWPVRQLRTSPFSISAIRRAGADHITVGTIDPIGAAMSTGGKQFRKDRQDVPVPVIGGARKTPQSIKRPSYKKLKGSAKVITIHGAYGMQYVMQRVRKYKRKEPRSLFGNPAFKAMYIMRPEVEIKKQFDMQGLLSQKMRENFPQEFVKACEYAMRTRK